MRRDKSFFYILILCFAGTILAKGEFKMNSTNVIEFNLPSYKITELNKNGITYTGIESSSKVNLNKKGFADLPYYSVTLEIEENGTNSYKIIDSEYKDINLNYDLLPSRGTIYRNQNPSKIPFETLSESVKDKWYPLNSLSSSEEFIVRTKRGQSILIYPFMYNAKKHILRVFNKLVIAKDHNFSTGKNELRTSQTKINSIEKNLYKSIFLNYDNNKDDANLTMAEEGDLLILYTSDNGGINALTDFINWKRAKGFNVTAQEVAVGTNVKETIKTAYENNPSLMYVQLVGDWAQIKSDLGTSASAPTDPMLGCVAGTDYFADIVIGRFSAETESELTIQLNKAINYEKNPDTDGSWYSKGLGIASDKGAGSGDDGEQDLVHMNVIKDNKLLPYNFDTINSVYDPSATASAVGSYINDGSSLINYIGHGSSDSFVTSGFDNNDVATLSNDNKLPVIISVACVNGEFQGSSDCFAEAWLRKENGGAVATLMSSINQAWAPPMRAQDYINDIIVGGYNYDEHSGQGGLNTTEQRTTFGSSVFNGEALMYTEAGTPSSGDDLETYQTWTIFGDATLQMRNDTPKEIETGTIALMSSIPWSGTLTSSGNPIANANIVVEQNGVYNKTTTNTFGQFTLNHTITSGVANLYITGYNLLTIAQEVPVASLDGSYLIVNDYNISGTEDKVVEFNSTNNLTINLKNIGTETANTITATLSTESDLVTINTNSTTLTTLKPEHITILESAFEVSFSRNITNKTTIPFVVTLTDESDKKITTSTILIKVNAPELKFENYTQASIPAPGEQANITLTLKNIGASDLDNGVVKLSSTTTYDLEFITSEFTLDGMTSGSEMELAFKVNIDSSIPKGTAIPFKVQIEGADTFKDELSINYLIGVSDGFESGDFTAMQWSNTDEKPWTIDSISPYMGTYSAKSGSITNNKESKLNLTTNFQNDSTIISFAIKNSSELNYDYLQFFVDNAKVKEWSGEVNWESFEYTVLTAGDHSFQWKYKKDSMVSDGEDCAWIDNLIFISKTGTASICDENLIVNKTTLSQNYPNPFNPTTNIKFSVGNQSKVSLNIFNSKGQMVQSLVNKNLKSGFYSVQFKANNFNSGVYFYRLKVENNIFTKKMILVK